MSIDTTALPPTEENLVVSYERMAHTYERGTVDTVLRTLDVVLAGVALVVLSPVIALTALAVLVAGGSPVLYRGQRVGRAGRVFTMMKFRTLRPDAEQRLRGLIGELDEYIRKHDYRFRHEGFGDEKDAPERAVARLAGSNNIIPEPPLFRAGGSARLSRKDRVQDS